MPPTRKGQSPTGRLDEGPRLQSFPIKTELGREIAARIRAEPIAALDTSGIELRLLFVEAEQTLDLSRKSLTEAQRMVAKVERFQHLYSTGRSDMNKKQRAKLESLDAKIEAAVDHLEKVLLDGTKSLADQEAAEEELNKVMDERDAFERQFESDT